MGKQRIPANEQNPKKQRSYLCNQFPRINKQHLKKLPINVIHLENYRYQNRDPVPYTNEERKELSESGLDPGRTNSYKRKKKKRKQKRREGRTQRKKKKKKKKGGEEGGKKKKKKKKKKK